MRPDGRRRHTAVSYKEPSSDDESEAIEPEASNQRQRASTSRRTTRSRVSSVDTKPSLVIRQTRTNSRGSGRRKRQRVSYKDVSTDEDDLDDPDADFEISDHDAAPMPRKSRIEIPAPRQSKTRPGKTKSSRKPHLGAPLKPNLQSSNVKALSIPSDGHIPQWTSLPYHVLLQVFAYASHPLRDENMKPLPSIPWLVEAARTCRAFTKPALTALYRNPPIFAMRLTRKDLVRQLISLPSDAFEDHRVMVKRLELDATQMTLLTDPANSVADLESLLQSLITLREIDIFDPLDRPPFRERMRSIRKWYYPAELFSALDRGQLHLQGWRWNRNFLAHDIDWMRAIHATAAFQSLRELILTRFHPPEAPNAKDVQDGPDTQNTIEEAVGTAICDLPNLKSLSFETCGIVSGRLLPRLPVSLVSLSITNCGELLSEDLEAFLITHGYHLKDLTLNYNQSLDLSFLVSLGKSCPRLETFRTDMTYFSSLTMSSDNDPLYETLLGENEIPSWPTTLRVLDMQFLRKWGLTSATNFLASLTNAAGELPWLRELTIIASVDADWRERAKFRKEWTALFKKVFAREWKAPNPHLVSLKAYRQWKEQSAQKDVASGMNDASARGVVDVHEDLASKSNDVSTEDVTDLHSHSNHNSSDSDAPIKMGRRKERWDSKRLRSRPATSYDESTEDEDVNEKAIIVQGRCHTVLFRIDNSRPLEEQFTEADFLDAEPSDDEDWDGNDHNNDEGGYAW